MKKNKLFEVRSNDVLLAIDVAIFIFVLQMFTYIKKKIFLLFISSFRNSCFGVKIEPDII